MTASKPDMDRFSAEAFGETDFAKVDAHVVQPHEYEEIPELTDEMMAGGVLCRNEPELAEFVGSQQRTLRLDDDIAADLRATGAGWERRGNAAIREWLQKRSA